MLDFSTLPTNQAISALFVGYFDRAPAPGGLAFWTEEVDSGRMTLAEVARSFVVQTETQDLFPGLGIAGADNLADNLALVTAIFNNLFGRDPNNIGENGGADNFWVNELQNGADVGELILNIMSGARGGDLALLENKIEVGLNFAAAQEAAGETGRVAAGDTILDGVTAADASVAAAQAVIDAEFAPEAPVIGDAAPIAVGAGAATAVIPGTAGGDIFAAESGDLTSNIRIDGGGGVDALTIINETSGVAVTPRTDNIEQVYYTNQANDSGSAAQNNVSSLDIELDGGRMDGVDRWENFDSRADLFIEDARDDTPQDGTFTRDITVAMVSTDPGNVDFAIYFDDPTGTPPTNSDQLSIEIIDQNNSTEFSAASALDDDGNNLEDIQLDEFVIIYDGTPVTIVLDPAVVGTDHFGPGATYAELRDAIQIAMNNTTLADGSSLGADVTATLDGTFFENIGNDNPGAAANAQVFGQRIILESVSGQQLEDFGANDIETTTLGEPADTAQAIRPFVRDIDGDLVTLNIELDDVGKGSTGGDLVAGAMSTGRNDGDRTSDSQGIERFIITVDRSSELQTINSTNNALEEVLISSGANTGINATGDATNDASFDEEAGDLVVRGQANPNNDGMTIPVFNTGTDNTVPGAVNEHNIFGFSDVRVINASAMTGTQADGSVASVDITAELTEEIVEKYLNIQDFADNGDLDDVVFDYDMGAGNDEFLLNMSADALNAAGTGSREDFNLDIDGNGGNDVITTNIGGSSENTPNGAITPITGTAGASAVKLIDEQGQDYYVLSSTNDEDWYENTVFNTAADFDVSGGSGDDVIWTHGWGNFDIADGLGSDVVYSDNSGVIDLSNALTNIDRNISNESDQIDYALGSVWVFNGESGGAAVSGAGAGLADLSGITNDSFVIGTGATATVFNSGSATVSVAFEGLSATNTTAASYVSDALLTLSASNYTVATGGGTGSVSIREQAMNQAIKEAINNNAVLSAVLEAVDGPGNSLVVYSKVDGAIIDADTLNVTVSDVTINGTSLTEVNTNTAYTLEGYENLAVAGGRGDSVAESDNNLIVAGDSANDVFVLSTNDDNGNTQPTVNTGTLTATELNGASNEVLIFNENFGTDTVFNFDFGDGNGTVDAAEDVLDFDFVFADNSFSASGPLLTAIAGPIVDGAITVVAETVATDTEAEIQALYTSFDTAASTGTREEIVIVYDNVDDDNAGDVYAVTDGAGAGDVLVDYVGTINLIGTDWSTLTLDNFA